MRFVSCMRVDPSTHVSALSAIAKRLDSYLQTHPYVEDGVFEEMSQLAQKLNNDALLEQCQVRHPFLVTDKFTATRGLLSYLPKKIPLLSDKKIRSIAA